VLAGKLQSNPGTARTHRYMRTTTRLFHGTLIGSCTDSHRRTCISPICASQLRYLEAGRGCVPPPAALVTRPTSTYFGARSFAVAGPTAWNQLPADVRSMVNSSNTVLKTFVTSVPSFCRLSLKSRHACLYNDFLMLPRVRNCLRYSLSRKAVLFDWKCKTVGLSF